MTLPEAIMKTFAVICNVVMWGMFCLVTFTDGLPTGTDIIPSAFFFVMPVCNLVVIKLLASPSRSAILAALAGNVVWLGLACWLIIDRYPSHPEEEGLILYVVLMALTPLVSMVALALGLRARGPEPPPPIATGGS